jgi:hypothetical protein
VKLELGANAAIVSGAGSKPKIEGERTVTFRLSRDLAAQQVDGISAQPDQPAPETSRRNSGTLTGLPDVEHEWPSRQASRSTWIVRTSQLRIRPHLEYAAFVRQATGYAIGGIPPLGHATPMPVLVDRKLTEFDIVYAAGGTPNALFPIAPADLVRASGGTVADVAP